MAKARTPEPGPTDADNAEMFQRAIARLADLFRDAQHSQLDGVVLLRFDFQRGVATRILRGVKGFERREIGP